ncbi:MAG: PAS domain S-box protein, partial [Chloroflexi bacterium]
RKQAEEALRASEEKYRGLIELSPVGMWINQGGTITYMNPAALQMLGANNLDQVVGKPALDFIHPRYHAAVQERASRLAGQGENVEPLQEQYIRLDGSLIDVEVTGSVYTTETGRAMQIFFQDITERKRIEERESRSRELLEKVVHLGKTITQVSDLQQCHREIIRCVRQGLDFDRVGLFNYDEETQQVRGVIGTDRTGEIEDTSYFIQTITEGSTWKNTLDDPAGVIHVLDYGERYSSLRQEDEMSDVKEHVTISAWAGEKPIAFLAVDNLITQRRMTPEQIEALRLFVGYVGLAIQKTRWSENLKQRVADLDSINQISQTLVAERELLPLIRAVGDQIRAMFAISVVYIALLDPQANMLDFYYQYENGRFTQGTQLEYGQGMTSRVMELRHPVLINSNWEQEAARYNVIRSGSPSKASLTVPLLVGEKAIGTISLQDTERENIFTEDHVRQLTTIAASLAVAIDNARLHTALQGELLERKQAEEAVRTLNADLEKRVAERTAQLESANRELESLSYTIGHDLRSPIRATVAYSQMLLEELSGQVADSQANKLQVVNQVSLRMGHMVDDFLTFLRLSRSPFQKSRINIAALAEEVIAEQKAEVARRQVLFSVMPMPECVADAHMLKDVLTHLISNAIKFTAHRVPARIEVGATEQQGITCYFVRDNGAGFNMKYSGKLFGVFQRLHRVDEFDGIGIDLAIVQRIIQRHGGRIWAEAEVDNGATFFFTVPPDSINQS